MTEEVEAIKTGNDLVKSSTEVKSVNETVTTTRRKDKGIKLWWKKLLSSRELRNK